MQKHFGIGVTPESITSAFQLDSEFSKVVDGAVKNHAQLAIGGQHRLMSRLAQVKDRQATMAQNGAVPGLNSLPIRPSPRQRNNHLFHGAVGLLLITESGYACDTTHKNSPATIPGSYTHASIMRLNLVR
jgi:hypothetical protein